LERPLQGAQSDAADVGYGSQLAINPTDKQSFEPPTQPDGVESHSTLA